MKALFFGASLLVMTSLTLVSCSTFRGPGELQGPGAFITPDQYEYPPRSQDVPKVIVPRKSGPLTLRWPVNSVRITQHFSPDKNKKHQGIDLGGRRGTAIFAAHDGMVVYAGKDFKGYGKMVLIEYNGEWASLYAHLDRIAVKEGQYVEKGQTIGQMGRTGRASGVHLHFELIRNKQTIDPVPLLGPANRFSIEEIPTEPSPFQKHIVYRRGEESEKEIFID